MGPLFHIEVPWKVSDEQTPNQDLKDLEKACPRQSEEAQAGINIAGRNINNLRYADDTTLMAESEEELKSHLHPLAVWREEGTTLFQRGHRAYQERKAP